ncbi:MAG TPA: GYD domain-containing protein [Gaiellaceae bacterium]|jgi:uncharacterized protein with GYD domain
MATYLIQVAYNTDGWKGLIASPQDRMKAITPAVEQLDGSVVAGWLAFGDYDVVAIIDLPTNVSAAAFSMAVSAGGTVKAFKTTPLMSMEEAVTAMDLAAESLYEPATAAETITR